ncbi:MULTISPECIES: ABC transporter ATP-binding protein [unclassified Neochlamydia]|uniref:ABC transporter ATP-binding protein n=1 Tax=unclassified Neochlamydia TaxID=2643326 RepID=UPI001BC8DFCF|nr:MULTISPECIES: ABC transporter ATP-binding protein [unclassified Neochlamydia]MBS4166611.1 Aliphatic sulfonates import ATP-binding protein SsuB [Neochlamydia sp. AcF65]MBS4171360.1 Aliphatic sulfonates import ATP-binding protein SsuB [Neochlamydia sp. AcF95]
MPTFLLKIQNLSFSFGEKKILKNLSLDISPNEVISLVGWSGSGKTTLFKLLAGLLPTEKGVISMATGYPAESIAFMAQEDLLLPWRTILENLLLPTELGKKPSSSLSLQQKAVSLLSEMGLQESANLYPEQLSGGMRQRVSLARALLQQRPLLLLDEPFNKLDVVLREQIYELLRKLKEKLNCTILMNTHDFRDAIYLADRILLLHDGIIYKIWKIENNVRHDPLHYATLSEEIRQALFNLIN